MTAVVKNPVPASPVGSMGTVIHRDRTFTFAGRTYRVIHGGRGWGYEVVTVNYQPVADGFHTLAEVRAYVDSARAAGRERLG